MSLSSGSTILMMPIYLLQHTSIRHPEQLTNFRTALSVGNRRELTIVPLTTTEFELLAPGDTKR